MTNFVTSFAKYAGVPVVVAPPNDASDVLGAEPEGLSLAFTDASIVIKDLGTPANNENSVGPIVGGQLAGPDGVLVYTAPSIKNTRQADSFIKYQAHNIFTDSASPATQVVTVINQSDYEVIVTGAGSIALSGAGTGTVTDGSPVSFTASTTSLTCTVTPPLTTAHVRRKPSISTYIETAPASTIQTLPYRWDLSDVQVGIHEEEQQTNLIVRNTAFEQSPWAAAGTTVTTNSIISPSGELDADQLHEDGGGASKRRNQQMTNSSGGPLTSCVYAKPAGRNWLMIRMSDSGGGFRRAWFDIQNGVLGNSDANLSTAIEDAGDGWFRCISTIDPVATNVTMEIFITNANGNINYTGDGVSGFHVWAAQGEDDVTIPSSPIITHASQVTRVADNISMPVSSAPFDTSQMSAYAQVIPGFDTGEANADRNVFEQSSGNNILNLQIAGGAAVNSRAEYGTGAAVIALLNGAVVSGTQYRQAFRAATDGALYTNGSQSDIDVGVFTGSAAGNWAIGSSGGSASFANSIIGQICIVPASWDNTELTTRSSTGLP